jgi:hypothetical protein
MAKKDGAQDMEAHVRGPLPPEDPDKEVDEHGLSVMRVSAGDKAEAEPGHVIAARSDVFDPNAAYRNKLGFGPGLQDSEANNPAVWVDENSEEARKASADAAVKRAEQELERVKANAEAVKKGEPLSQEIR